MSAVCVAGAIIVILFGVIWVLIKMRPRRYEPEIVIRMVERKRGWF